MAFQPQLPLCHWECGSGKPRVPDSTASPGKVGLPLQGLEATPQRAAGPGAQCLPPQEAPQEMSDEVAKDNNGNDPSNNKF